MTVTYFFTAIVRSFFSQSFYREVGRKWQGAGLRYLLLVLILGGLPITIGVMVMVGRIDFNVPEDLLEGVRAISTQLPVITITKGEAHIDEVQPYYIIDPRTDKPLIIIDTTGKVTSLIGNDAGILLTKRDIYLKISPSSEERYPLSDIIEQDMVIDQNSFREWVESAKRIMVWFMPLIFLPVFVIASFLYTLFKSFILSVAGLAIARMLNILSLRFQDVFRLSVVASTPVIFFEMLAIISPPRILFHYQEFIFFALTLIYLYVAVSANQQSDDHSA